MARRYAAILAADVTGYRGLPANDERPAGQKGHPPGILPMITGFEGRLVDRPGSGILVEFLDVVDAAKCAASLQDVMQERNAGMVPERRTQLRIGIDHGEVVAEGNRLTGENVEVAARLEAICEPGGICISDRVYDRIKGRFHGPFREIDEQPLKDGASPVRAYRIDPVGTAPGKRPEVRIEPTRSGRPRGKLTAAASVAAIVLLSVGIGATWLLVQDGTGDTRIAEKPRPAEAPAVVVEAKPAVPAQQQADRPAGGDFQVAALPAGASAAIETPPSPAAAAVAMPPAEGASRVEVHVAQPKPAEPAAAPPAKVAGPSVAPVPPAPAQAAEPAPAPAPQTAAEPTPPPAKQPEPAKAAESAEPPPAQVAALSPSSAPAAAPVAEPPAAPEPPPPAAVAPKPAPAAQDVASLPPSGRVPLDEKARDEFIAELSKKGVQAAISKDYPFAKLWFDEILLMQPDNLQALNNRCWINALMNELAAAMKDCDAALKLRPTFLDALDSRGFVKLKSGKAREAIADYDAALKIQGNKASALYGRGVAKKRSGNAAGGDADIKRALSANPRIADEFASYGIR